MSDEPELGSEAPNFTLPSHLNRDVQIAELQGKKTVLLFYVFDFSPG